MKPAPAIGDVWRSPLGGTWRIVGRSPHGRWGLSGPGPLRSAQYVSTEELVAEWTYVPAEEA